jgi:GTP-binding protein
MRLTLVGRPNVGKSSILNCILGEERSLVHHEAGTTRDAVDTLLDFEGRRIRMVDTAGLRKRAKVDDDIEFYSTLRALTALQRSQVGVLVLDGTQPIATQDQKIAGEIQKAEIASVIVVNKWDLIPGTEAKRELEKQKFIKSVSEKLDFLSHSTVIFVSALTGEEIHDILAAALDAHEQWSRRLDTSTLNLVIREAVALKPPPTFKTQQLKVLYVTQQKAQPPTIVFKVNSPKLLHFSYRRYLENKVREAFGFVGSPIVTKFER